MYLQCFIIKKKTKTKKRLLNKSINKIQLKQSIKAPPFKNQR